MATLTLAVFIASPPLPALSQVTPLTDEDFAALLRDMDPELLEDILTAVPVWQRFFTVKTGAGYKDNVLLSDINQQRSPFAATGLDFFASRMPGDFGQIDFFASIEDTRYLRSIDVDSEQIAFARLNLTRTLTPGTRVELPLQYIYVNQVTDVSATEANLDILKIRGNAILFEPSVRLEGLGPNPWRAEVRVDVQRQFLDSPLDDYWEVGPALRLGRAYGHESDLYLDYKFSNRGYDTDEAVDEEGQSIPGTSRAFTRNETQLQWRHFWDASNHWRSTSRLSWQLNQDNESGFFDYNRYRAAHQLRFKSDAWTLTAEARYTVYRYTHQTVSNTDSNLREREETSFHLGCQRRVSRHILLYAEYEREVVTGNINAEEYTANTVSGGLLWDF